MHAQCSTSAACTRACSHARRGIDPCVGVRHWSTGHARRDWTSLITHDAILAADNHEGLEAELLSSSLLAPATRVG